MRCCRYMKFDYAEESLRTGLYKVSHPSEFNDPFECRGKYINYEEPLRKYVHDNYDRLKFEKIRNWDISSPAIQAGLTETALFLDAVETFHEVLDDSWIGAFDGRMYIMCFVKERGLKSTSDVLFWSHYADSGRGVKITFDMPEDAGNSPYYVREVNYADKVPVFDCRQMKELFKGEEVTEYIDLLSYTKGRAWEYENEVRMFISREHAESKYLCKKKDSLGGEIVMVRLGHLCVRRVDFGPRVDRERASRLISNLKQLKDASQIGFYEACLRSGEYVYDYKKIA